MIGEPSERYVQYINSPAWQAKRQQAFDFYGRQCDECGATKYLEIHHRTYKRFGRESVEDLQVLCGDCHIFADIRRKREEKIRKDAPLMEKWAAETYGPLWFDDCDWPDMMDRFHSAQADACNRFLRNPMEDELWFRMHEMFGRPRSMVGG